MKQTPALPPSVQALVDLERRHALFDFRVDGWSAWRVMRNALHFTAIALPYAPPARSNLQRSLQALLATCKLGWLLLSRGPTDVLVKTCRSGLRMAVGERFRDVYFDGLLDRGFKYLKFEEINSLAFERQAAAACHPAVLDPVLFTFWGKLLGTLFPAPAKPFCERVAALLEQEASLKLSPAYLLMRVSTVYWQARLYAMVLARLRPRMVLVSDTGEYGLSIACKRRGVRFVELQHGVFDANHPDAIPEWVAGSAAELVLPDQLACRGEYWIAQLASTRQGRDQALPVGNELIDLARARRARRPTGGPLQLVVTSQGMDTDQLARWLARMVEAAPADREWRMAIKLHPVYDANTHSYDIFSHDARVSVVGGAEQPNVFDLLADADLHLSIASACHFDAASLGVATIIVPLAGHEAMLDTVDAQQFFLAAEPAQVWALADAPAAPEALAHRFSTPGFVDNLARLLS